MHLTLISAGSLEAWLLELLPRALDWAAARPRPVEPTAAGLVASALSHMLAPTGGGRPRSKAEAAAALARGVGAHLEPGTRAELAAELAR
jgi:hypothetical protein